MLNDQFWGAGHPYVDSRTDGIRNAANWLSWHQFFAVTGARNQRYQQGLFQAAA